MNQRARSIQQPLPTNAGPARRTEAKRKRHVERPSARTNPYARWRAGTLCLVYLLMTIHVLHWRLAGRTLAPLELNEVMYTLELGIVTAGFLFMTLAVVATAIFGRFFCSWGCHILALEDLCAWLLEKMRIRPKPVRSRVLMLVPLVAMLYMFVWPQASRLAEGRPAPILHLRTDAQGWASFITSDFARNLPGPGIALLTFALCGFAMVYFLGSRAFCTYACPYGAVFGLADRLAPGRIVAMGDCSSCGICTAVCQSHIRVHEEATLFGRIVSPRCLKDLDCVAACPDGVLQYGLARPSLFQSFRSAGRKPIPYDFSLAEDALMAVVFLAALFIFRGLYGEVPFLLTLGIGGMLAYAAVMAVRLIGLPHVRFNNFQLKINGELTRVGWGAAAAAFAMCVFTAHSGFIRYHEYLGVRAGDGATDAAGRATALRHLETARRWGLFERPDLPRRMASLKLLGQTPLDAEPWLRRALDNSPGDVASRLDLARVLLMQGHYDEASAELSRVPDLSPPELEQQGVTCALRATQHELRGRLMAARGDADGALRELAAALRELPDGANVHAAMGELLAGLGRLEEAERHLRRAVDAASESASARYNLAVVLSELNREDEALEQYRACVELNPFDAESRNNLGFLLARRGAAVEAETCFRRAIELNPRYAHPHFNLARLLEAGGRVDEANAHYQAAARLDPRYARLLLESGKR
ncbi:MAG: tetratricopeptide repeat protein [Phycisphaerae bacterium]|nr:tetratricopeptide repeat protein [Phycisphaerae bacterium]NUQ46469.1 tetratricopeptide repeat protein [Phycisphaerae bacterium]